MEEGLTAPTDAPGADRPQTSLAVRSRLVEALKLDLVGPPPGHALADEKLPGWVRPSNWYLTGFLIPSGTPPEKSSDADENDDFELVPESAGLAEESTDERKAAKRGYFPSSMGLSFLVAGEARALEVRVVWGDYLPQEITGGDGKPVPVWQREPHAETVNVPLSGVSGPEVYNVPRSGGLQINVVERAIAVEDLGGHLPAGARSVSVFLVNRRPPNEAEPDRAYVFQAGLEVHGAVPFLPRPDLRGRAAADWDEQVADLHYADTPE
jgi:hypothetical protein